MSVCLAEDYLGTEVSGLFNFKFNVCLPCGIACLEKICSALILWQLLSLTSYYLCKFQMVTVQRWGSMWTHLKDMLGQWKKYVKRKFRSWLMCIPEISIGFSHASTQTQMVCDPKVRVRVFTCKSLQSSNIKPRESLMMPDNFPWIVYSVDNFDFGLTLVSVSEVSRNKIQMQQPSFQKRGFARAKHQGPG